MSERSVMVSLGAPGAETSRVSGTLVEFSPSQRAVRAAVVLLVAVLLAGLLIPVPLVHLLGIPLLLLTGIVLAVRQASSVARLKPLRIPCPKCGGVNRVGGGLGYSHMDWPRERMCENCRRHLVLAIE